MEPDLDLQGRLPLLPPVKPISVVGSVVGALLVGIRPLVWPLPGGIPLLAVPRPVPRIGVRLVRKPPGVPAVTFEFLLRQLTRSPLSLTLSWW